MCKGDEKSADHLLLYCSKVKILWQLVFSLIGVARVMHSFVRGHLLSEEEMFQGHSFIAILDIMKGRK